MERKTNKKGNSLKELESHLRILGANLGDPDPERMRAALVFHEKERLAEKQKRGWMIWRISYLAPVGAVMVILLAWVSGFSRGTGTIAVSTELEKAMAMEIEGDAAVKNAEKPSRFANEEQAIINNLSDENGI